MSSTLVSSILAEVRKRSPEWADQTDEQLHGHIFQKDVGLRLSFSGFLILKNIFTVYSFEITSELKSRHYIGMSSLEYPYYVSAKRLVLFSEMDSLMIKLHGDVAGFLENCYNSRQGDI